MTSSETGTAGDAADLADELLRIQLAGDSRAAIATVERVLAVGGDVRTIRAAITLAQREVGRLWAEDRISVAQEHQITAIAHVVLAHVYCRAPIVARRGPRVVIACVPGELHAFPARLAADTLDLAGYGVAFLGADVPLESLVSFVRGDRPDVLALSVTLASHLPRLAEEVAALRDVAPQLPVLVGGAATEDWPSVTRALGVEGAAHDADGLLALVERIR